jgi:carbamoyl-phosphate synthase large subunit
MGVREVVPKHVAVKEAVFPFVKFPGVDTILGPEMRSTGEVMGIDRTFEAAFAKSQIAAGTRLPVPNGANGRPQGVFISVQDLDKPGAVAIARDLRKLGFRILATGGTSEYLKTAGVETERVNKVSEGRPHCVDRMLDGGVVLVINTTAGAEAIKDSFSVRRTALTRGLPYYTTISAARAATGAIAKLAAGALDVCSLQEFQEERAHGR